MDYIKAVRNFNRVGGYKLCVPSLYVLERLQPYTDEVLKLTEDASRYEECLKRGHVDDVLGERIGKAVLYLNQVTKGVIPIR
mgnify:CR=1 FL=1